MLNLERIKNRQRDYYRHGLLVVDANSDIDMLITEVERLRRIRSIVTNAHADQETKLVNEVERLRTKLEQSNKANKQLRKTLEKIANPVVYCISCGHENGIELDGEICHSCRGARYIEHDNVYIAYQALKGGNKYVES